MTDVCLFSGPITFDFSYTLRLYDEINKLGVRLHIYLSVGKHHKRTQVPKNVMQNTLHSA